MRAAILCAVLLAGCGKRAPATAASCEAMAEALYEKTKQGSGGDAMLLAFRRAMAAACIEDGWSARVVECITEDPKECHEMLTQEQQAKLAKRFEAVSKEEMEKQAKAKAEAEAEAEGTQPEKQPIPSPLPERGPHSEYPTPVAAGTDQIFTLEEPERGPRAPLSYAMPPRAQLAWTTHVHCEDGIAAIACSAPGGRPPRMHWRVGRRGKELVIAQAMRGDEVERTYVYAAKADGAPVQRLIVDRYGAVESAVLFRDGPRYSARLRNGGNALAGCGSMAYRLDARRGVEELRCLQWTGEPMRDTDGVAVRRFVRDPRGFALEEARFAADGAPVVAHDGVHRVVRERDEHGRVRVERYRGPSGEPARSSDNCFAWRTERDAHGAEVRGACLDADDRPTARVARMAISEHRYDDDGCRVAVRYKARDGAAAMNDLRVHGLDYGVDERCAVISYRCLNIVEQPQPCGPGKPARYEFSRDARGRMIAAKHYAADGAPARDPMFGTFERRDQLDEAGNLIGQSCYDVTGQPVACGTASFHARKTTYDDAGRQLTETYYDPAGGESSDLGAVSRRFRYDVYDHRFESVSLDQGGAPLDVRGAAIRRDLYDAAHRRFAVLMLDKQSKPARYTGCYAGASCPKRPWHAVRIERHANGAASSNKFFDEAGQLLETRSCSATPCFD